MKNTRIRKLAPVSALTFTLLLSACSAPATTTGISFNPCLAADVKDSKYCQAGPGQATRVTGVNLSLAEIPAQVLVNSLRLPLQAQALFSQVGAIPPNSYVEFSVDGKLVGKVPSKDLGKDLSQLSTFFLQLVEPLAAGLHQAVAVLKGPDGALLATSNTIDFTMPPASDNGKPAIAMLAPLAVTPVNPGGKVALLADLRLPAGVRGERVEFYSDGKLLGTGTRNPDGTYSFDLNTTGMLPGTYPLTAVVKGADGTVLASSEIAPLVIGTPPAAPAAGNITLALLNLAGRNRLQIGQQLPLSGQLIVNAPLPLNSKLKFYANGLQIGEATVDAAGHYRMTWSTEGLKAGEYLLEAKLFSPTGQLMVTSNPLKITLDSGVPALAGVTLADLPASVFPGSKQTLRASVQLPPGLEPSQARVEFMVNGKSIGNGTRNPDGSWTIVWNTGGLPEGPYEITAVVFGPQGKLAESDVSKVKISALSQASVSMSSGNLSAAPGSTVSLTATAQLSEQELRNGAYVEFRQNGQVLGKGQLQPDGSWKYDWNTSGKPAGDYPVEAVLVSGIGAVLARSNEAIVSLGQAKNAIRLLDSGITAKAGSSVALGAGVTLDASVKNPTVQFVSNGQVLGNAVRQSDGSWRLDWDTAKVPAGEYPVVAVLLDGGRELARSSQGTVKLDALLTRSIRLTRPSDGASFAHGAGVDLEAQIAISEADRQAGVLVEFHRNGQRVAVGSDQGSDRYQGDWDANGSGKYELKAVLKNLQGQVLAESESISITVREKSSSGGGGGVSADASVALTNPAPATTVRVAVGENFAINATATISGAFNNQNPYVEFFANSSSIGRATLNSGVWTYSWNTGSISPGTQSIVARVGVDNNPAVAVSELGTIELISNSVTLNAPSDDSVRAVGESVLLSATPVLSDSQSNATVEFYDGSTLIGTGTRQLDGSYTRSWDTSNVSAGPRQITAKVVLNSQTLATSTAADLNLISNSVSLTSPAAASSHAAGDTVTFSASANLSASQVAAGYKIRLSDAASSFSNDYTPTLSSGTTYTVAADLTFSGATGSRNLVATIIDGNGSATSVTDTRSVTVNGINVSLSTPADGAKLTPGGNHSLSGTVSAVPAGGSVRFVIKNSFGTVVDTITASNGGSGTTYGATWNSPASPDDYSVTLEVLNSSNSVVNSDSNDIVLISNSVSMTSPADSSSFTVNDTTSLTASAQLTAAQLAAGYKLRFSNSGGQIGADVTPTLSSGTTYTGSISSYNVGSSTGGATLTVQLVDGSGNVVSTDSNSITVNAVVTPSATLGAPAANAVIAPSSTGNSLSGTATGIPAGGSVRFVVKNSGGSTIDTLTGSNGGSGSTYSASWDAPATAGDYTITIEILNSGSSVVDSDSDPVHVISHSAVLTAPADGTDFAPSATTNLTASAQLTAAQVSAGYKLRFLRGASQIGSDVTPVLSSGTTYTGTISNYDVGSTTGSATLTLQLVNASGTAVATDSNDISITTPASPEATLSTPATGTVLAPSGSHSLSGTATGIPSGGSVRFLVKNSGGTTIDTLTGSNGGSGSTYSATWSAPPTAGDYSIVLEILNSGSSVVDSDTHTVHLITNTASVTTPAEGTAFSVNDITSLVATAQLTAAQVTAGYKLRFSNSGGQIGSDVTPVLSSGTTYTGTIASFNVGSTTGNTSVTVELINSSGSSVANDSNGYSVNAVVSPEVTLTTPASGVTLPQSASRTVSGTAVGIPAGGTVKFVIKDSGGGTLETLTGSNGGSGTTYSASWVTPSLAGTYSVVMELRSSADALLDDDSHSVSIVTNSISLSPADGASFQIGASTNLVATAQLSAGQVSAGYKIRFLDGGVQIGSDLTPTLSSGTTYTATISNHALGNTAGSKTLTARIVDGSGNPLASDVFDSNAVTLVNYNYSIGPKDTFGDLGSPPAGPAFLNIALPGLPFDPDSLPPGTHFPDMPASLDTNSNYSGTDSRVVQFFFGDGSGYPAINPAGGDLTFDNNVQITSYDADFYGETINSGTPFEFINRTRAVVNSVVGKQSVTTIDTGIRTANAGLTLSALGTAPVTLASNAVRTSVIAGTNFTINLGSNGTFSFATVMGRSFDATTDTIDTIIQAINAYGTSLSNGGTVSASISNGVLTINNDPPNTVQGGTFVEPVKFVESQIKIRLGTANGDIITLNNPSDETIQSVLNKFNAAFPGVASFDWTSLDDKLVLDLTKVTSSTSYFNQYGKRVMVLVDSGAVGQGDGETNGLDLGQFFKLSYTPANQYASANGISDGDFGAADGALEADGTGKIISPEIDNGDDVNGSHPFEITANIATTKSLTFLSTSQTQNGDNSISFGTDAVSLGLMDFFNVVNKTDTTTGLNQSTASTSVISSSVNLNPGAPQTIAELLTAQVPSLSPVAGPLVIDGSTRVADVSTQTIAQIVSAINGFVSGDRTYSASFDGNSGQLTITVTDSANLTAPGSAQAPSPLGGVKKNARELSNDTSAFTP